MLGKANSWKFNLRQGSSLEKSMFVKGQFLKIQSFTGAKLENSTFGKNQILNRGQKLKIWCLAKDSSLKFNLWQGSNLEILCLGRPHFETLMFK